MCSIMGNFGSRAQRVCCCSKWETFLNSSDFTRYWTNIISKYSPEVWCHYFGDVGPTRLHVNVHLTSPDRQKTPVSAQEIKKDQWKLKKKKLLTVEIRSTFTIFNPTAASNSS